MKKRKGTRFSKKPVDLDKDVDDIDPESQDFFYDEVDRFHAERDGLNQLEQFDSEDSDGSAEEEIFGIDCSDVSDEEDVVPEDDEDTEEEEDDGIPSSKAWGKKKSSFFGAEDVKGLQGPDRDEIEDDEEEEALKIQQRLAEEIDEDQFQLFQVTEAGSEEEESSKEDNEKVAVDVSSLSAKAQWKLLKQESPELKELIADFKEKLSDLKSTIIPLQDLVKEGKIVGNGAIYLINKLSKVDEKLEDEIEKLLNPDDNASVEEQQSAKKSTAETDKLTTIPSLEENTLKETKKKLKQKPPPKVEDPIQHYVTLSERLKLQDEEEQKKSLNAGQVGEVQDDDNDRRAITYTMKKNKGAQAKKRKTDRNPRVKHREMYRRAKIRRKGQVREYRPEMQKYSGEATGIRAGVIRGVRIQ